MADQQFLTIPRLHTKHIRRIFSKIAVNRVTGCWEWTGALNTGGYGQTSILNIRATMHRFMYAWLVEPIPKGLAKDVPQLDHIACDNRRCCNPAHVQLTTAQINVLRGSSIGASYAKRTHCKHGHPFTRERGPGAGRLCDECRKTTHARERHRKEERRRRERLRKASRVTA